MTTHCRFALACIVVCLGTGGSPASARAQTTGQLTVVSAGPTEEVANLAEANEVRVVFSEPMVTLGRIPDPVRPPFFRITPAARGTFRWSGTTILIFTPDPKQPLPLATRFTVTIDATATAVSGRKLAEPYSFTFTTPTTKLLQSNWYRRDGRADAPVVLVLRFNQPVRPADVAAHLSAGFEPHNWTEPVIPQAIQQRLTAVDPTAIGRFQAKARQTRAAASARSPVTFRLTRRLGQEGVPARSQSRRVREHDGRSVRKLGEGGARRASSVTCRRRGSRNRAELRRPGRAGVLHQRIRLHRGVRSGSSQPAAPSA